MEQAVKRNPDIENWCLICSEFGRNNKNSAGALLVNLRLIWSVLGGIQPKVMSAIYVEFC